MAIAASGKCALVRVGDQPPLLQSGVACLSSVHLATLVSTGYDMRLHGWNFVLLWESSVLDEEPVY